MSDAPERAASPRTQRHSQAFTFSEFANGAFVAWLYFQPMGMAIAFAEGVVAGVAQLVSSAPITSWPGIVAYGFIALLMGGALGLPTSVAALFGGAPLAYVLVFALRGVRAIWVHLAIFAAYGAVVSVATTWIFDIVLSATSGETPNAPQAADALTYIPFSIAGSAAVLLGRLKMTRLARKTDDLSSNDHGVWDNDAEH